MNNIFKIWFNLGPLYPLLTIYEVVVSRNWVSLKMQFFGKVKKKGRFDFITNGLDFVIIISKNTCLKL